MTALTPVTSVTHHRVKTQALWTARCLALLGVLIICTEVVRNWVWGHAIEWWVVVIGASFGFVGFYLLDPTKALTAFGFLRDSTVQIIGVVRSGRRATDPIVPQVAVTDVPPAGGDVSAEPPAPSGHTG